MREPSSAPAERQNPATRPNVVLLVADDLGAWANGRCTPEIHTPTLDRLADEGTVLDSFFCASPVCSPARASILTGRMPSAHGIHDWITPDGLARTASPQRPFSTDFLEDLPGADTIPALLNRHGYRCGMVGKWHVGSSDQPAPGYEYWYAHQLGGGPYFGAPIWRTEPTGAPAIPPEPSTERSYFTDAVTDRAIDFLERSVTDDRPFFLHVNWTAPHDPWFDDNHPSDLRDLYSDTDFPSVPAVGAHPWFDASRFPRATKDRRGALIGYAAAVSGIDRSVNSILQRVEEIGERSNTIVIFTSDNGFSCGHHGIWGKGNATAPLNFWEPSIKVPFIVRWPGRVESRRVITKPASATSILETIAELTDSRPSEDALRPGRSIAGDLLTSTDAPRPDSTRSADERVVIYDEYGAARMIRVDGWKLVERHDGPTELYDLEEDPGEVNNVAASGTHDRRARSLAGELRDWFREHEVDELSGRSTGVDGFGQSAPMRNVKH